MSEVRNAAVLQPQQRRVLRYIILFVLISRILLMFRSEERIYTRPFMEDSFYLFNCAEHFAHGEGFTCDGEQPTNGVQPLIVILYAPLFLLAGANKLLALKLAFILIALFDSLSIIFIARLVRLLQKKPDEKISSWKSPPIIAAILWAGLYPIFVHNGNGLETGIYSVMLLASLYYYTKLSRLRTEGIPISLLQWITCGVILGFTVLARIDAVFLVIAIAGYELYKYKAKGFVNGCVISLSAFLISSPWWLYNLNVFGSLMPQSGVAESFGSLIGENLTRAAIVVGDIFSVFIFLPNYSFFAWFHYLWFAGLLLIILWAMKKFLLHHYLNDNYRFSPLIPYFLFCLIIAIYYLFFFSAPYFIPRYFHPLRIGWLIIFSCASVKIIKGFRNQYKKYQGLILVCTSAFLLVAIGFSMISYLKFFLINQPSELYLVGKWAISHPSARIGMEQSGTAGFIAPNVINLDGKVNYAALLAKQKGDIGEYVEREKLDYIIDWHEFSDQITQSAARHGGKFSVIDSFGKVIIYQRIK
jgi:hypothetical protein